MIYAASLLATHNETQVLEHHLFTFTLHSNPSLTPEQNATQEANDLLNGDLDTFARWHLLVYVALRQ